MGNQPIRDAVDHQEMEIWFAAQRAKWEEEERRERVYQQAVHWDTNVVGQTEAKRAIEYAFFLPRRFPSYFRRNQTANSAKLNRLLLLWGPPGTGKTLIAKAVADAHGGKFQVLQPGNIKSKYHGETDSNILNVFEKAKTNKTVIFIDEVDAFMRRRTSREDEHNRAIKTQFLQSIDEFGTNMSVDSALICATNTKDELDDAFLRRITCHIFCGLPSEVERSNLFKHHLGTCGINHNLTDQDILYLASRTDYYMGSDIKAVVELAAMGPIVDLQSATHFIRNAEGKYTACSGETRGARPMSLKSLPEDSLAPGRSLDRQDFERALERRKATTDKVKYQKYLRQRAENVETEATQQINSEATKSPYDKELESIFSPMNEPEIVRNSIFRVFIQLQRFDDIANDPNSYISSSVQFFLLFVLVSIFILMLLMPVLLWWLFAAIFFTYLIALVIAPLSIIFSESWKTFDMKNLMSYLNAKYYPTLITLVFVLMLSYLNKMPYFNFSSFRVVNSLIMFGFLLQLSELANKLIIFIRVKDYYERSLGNTRGLPSILLDTLRKCFQQVPH